MPHYKQFPCRISYPHYNYITVDYSYSINFILLFEKIKTSPRSGEPLILSVRARDKGSFEYFCSFAEVPIDSNGLAGLTQSLDSEFEIVK